MKPFVLALLVSTMLAFPDSLLAGDSYLYVIEGRAIANGEPVNNKALKAKYSGSYFWFSLDGESYIVRDPKVLERMKPIYDPVFSFGGDFTFGEQLTVFAQQMEIMKEQLRIGVEPKPGEDPRVAARRIELKQEQNRLARRQNELARRANAAAVQANDFARRLDDINRRIEEQLHDLATGLVELRVAVRVND